MKEFYHLFTSPPLHPTGGGSISVTESNRKPARLSDEGRRRLTRVIVLSIVVIILLLLLVAQSGFNLQPLVMPETPAETLLFYALSALNFLAFITVLFVLMRHVLKLIQERRAGQLGSKFKARLVSYAIGLSLLPALLLFFFAFGLLNRSVDRWFGDPARQIVDNAKEIEESYFKKEESEVAAIARATARAIALNPQVASDEAALVEFLKLELSQYNLALARLIARNRQTTVQGDTAHAPKEIIDNLDWAAQQAAESQEPFTSRVKTADARSIYILAAVNVSDADALVVARQFPDDLTHLADSINEQHANFHNLLGKIKRIKTTYVLLLAAVTLLLIFAASWLALYVARSITVPIQALAEATQKVARGDFTHRVDVLAQDELVSLIGSFNRMAAQLQENRLSLERAAEDLSRTNLALDDRRRYIETVLESLSTGVISTDEKNGIATINRAAIDMLGLESKPDLGAHLCEVIREQGESLLALCRRARRSETAQAEIEFHRADGSILQTATTAIALKNAEGALDGWVIVIEDLTDLIQAERAAAWSEVARRMAHEIKNPLTPIQLSAERMMRNYNREKILEGETRFERVLTEGTATIVREVAALQRMVEEFSRFARLPEARPVESSLNDVVRDAVSLYNERLDSVRMDCLLAEDLPSLRLDTEQIKRVLVNLIDNALESLASDPSNGGNKTITIETAYLKSSERARLIVSDTGHGIRPADRDKLFLPKFSTRDRGTGLGLAIVHQIIADHKGRIWVEDNRPRGARFIIEFPAG
ncbi:MAG: ATP-binding protein [Acidobacteriota bacterium]